MAVFSNTSLGTQNRVLRGVPDDRVHRPPGGDNAAAIKVAGVLGAGLLAGFWGIAVATQNINAVFLCVALLASIAIAFDFRIGVVLLIILMPFSASDLFPHEMLGITGLNPLNLLLLATLLSWLLNSLAARRGIGLARFVPAPLLWLYIAPIVAAGVLGTNHLGEISMAVLRRYVDMEAVTSEFGYLQFALVKPMLLVVFALLVAAAVSRSEKPERFMAPILVSIWIMAGMAIGYYLLSGASLEDLSASTARGFFGPLGLHANDLGRIYASAFALCLFTWAATDNLKLSVPLLATMALVVAALVLTFSRGAFLGFLLVCVLFLMSRRDAKSLFILGCLGIGLTLVGGVLLARLQMGFGMDANTISAGRINGIWLPLLPEVWRNPVFGNGLSSILWSDAIRQGIVQPVSHPHSAYLRTLLDMGLVGLTLLCAYFAHVWWRLRKLGRDPGTNPTLRGFYAGGAAGLVSFLLAGFAGSALTPVPEQSFLWLAIGMMYGQYARKREAEAVHAHSVRHK